MGGFRVQRVAWLTKLMRGIGCTDLVRVALCMVIRMAMHGFRENSAEVLAQSNESDGACFFPPAIRPSCPERLQAIRIPAAEIARSFTGSGNRSNHRFSSGLLHRLRVRCSFGRSGIVKGRSFGKLGFDFIASS